MINSEDPLEGTAELSNLKPQAERTLDLARRLDALMGLNSDDVNVTALSRFLTLQHADGCWGSDDYPVLKAVFTAQAVMTLSLMGLADTDRPVLRDGNASTRARDWLITNQRADGSWGEDAFDTCEVLKALHVVRLSADHETIIRGLEFLCGLADREWAGTDSFWSGTGFIGSALEVFNLFGDNNYVQLTLQQLRKCYDRDEGRFGRGAYRGASLMGAPLEWHNACAILGLRSFGALIEDRVEFNSAVAWLRSAQNAEGAWCPGHDEITAICTYQVIVALTQVDGPQSPGARKGADWLVLRSIGGQSGSGYNERFMAGAVVARTRAHDLRIEVGILLLGEMHDALRSSGEAMANADDELQELSHARARLSSLEEDLQAARQQLSENAENERALRDKLDSGREAEAAALEQLGKYAFKLTGNQLAVWGLALAILTFFAGVYLSIALS